MNKKEQILKKIIYKLQMDLPLTKEENMLVMITGGRTRWKVENEGNNVLKNQGYNFEHNFGHGQENLSEILLSLNLLGFLFHNILELANDTYQKIREKLVRRKTFFNDIRALLKYIWFESWQDLFTFIFVPNSKASCGSPARASCQRRKPP